MLFIIEIEPDCINIISFPGIDCSVPMEIVKKGERFRTRVYRNRRLGEFLKELHLSEGHSTGIPTIQDELARNGSPWAIFETDEQRRGLYVRIPIHPDFLKINDNNINKKVDIESEKVDIKGEKIDIGSGRTKMVISKDESKDRFAIEISREGLMNQIQRLKIYEERLREMRASRPTIENMHRLYQTKGNEQIFSRKDVVAELGLSPAGASKFIAKLLQAEIVVNVKGYGKGRYKFVEVRN